MKTFAIAFVCVFLVGSGLPNGERAQAATDTGLASD
jgi:hypothetical protein